MQAIQWPTLTPADVKKCNDDAAKLIKDNKLDAVKKTEPTSKYNCHSYAWTSTYQYWIRYYKINTSTGVELSPKQNNLSVFWTDGSYVLITNTTSVTIPSNVPVGAKVSYVNGDHSARVISSTKFRSKWGSAGEYEHSPGHAPYPDTTSLSYYKYYKN